MGPRHRSFMMALIVAGSLSLATPTLRAQTPVSERQVKAAFLFNFIKFVTWPAESFHSPDEPMTLCVIGNEPIGEDLQRLLTANSAKSRPLKMERVDESQSFRRCHVVFFGSDQVRQREFLTAIAGLPILTVGEAGQFGRWGGIITFVMDNDRVRFEINQDAADRARLKISSKLLSLARSVTVGRGGP